MYETAVHINGKANEEKDITLRLTFLRSLFHIQSENKTGNNLWLKRGEYHIDCICIIEVIVCCTR